MKKTKKALATLAIAGMTLSMIPFNVFAASTVPARIAGGTAAQTAVAIAEQTGWNGVAVLASSAPYAMMDALSAGPLAASLKAPILLTGGAGALDADTKAELAKLAVKTVYVTSGTAVISQAVLNELTGMGMTVVALGGADQFETSVNIAKKMTGVTKVAVAGSLQDALSIAAIAAAANEPILLTNKDALPPSVAAYLKANPAIVASDVIGGTGVISDAVMAQLPKATRHAGNSAYDTNNQVIQDFNAAITYGNVFLANGETGIDALAGAPLAAMTKSAIVLTNGATTAAAAFVNGKLAATSVVTALGGTAVVPASALAGVGFGAVAPTGDFTVKSVTATGANSIKVVFNAAAPDTKKVNYAVTRSSIAVAVTPTWNATFTELTLTSSYNLPEGTYDINLKNDKADMGTKSVAITQQKVAKISITSTKLAIAQPTGSETLGRGYASYKVFDQYDNDITTSYLANNITFSSGVTVSGNTSGKDGLLTLIPNVNMIQFSSVVVTASDSTSGVSTSATLATSTAIGTISDLKLNKLTNSDNKVLTDGDTSSVFYLDYTATDLSGNPTKDYNLVKNGLILSGTGSDELTVSNTYVTAKVVKDPNDDSKAAIEVRVVGSTNAISMDLPLTITAMTYTGTTSSYSGTFKKAAAPDSVSLMAPTYEIATSEVKEVPFLIYDQNGTKVTKFTDINGVVTLNGVGTQGGWFENVDGTAKLMVEAQSSKGPQIITATTTTGKLSTLTLNIVDTAKADSFAVNTNQLINVMQAGSRQALDNGYSSGGLTLKDQYGRAIDFKTLDPNQNALGNRYVIVPSISSVTTPGAITVSGVAKTGKNAITIKGNAVGTATVKLDLVDKQATGFTSESVYTSATVVSTQSFNISVIKADDITNYMLTTVANPIYAVADTTTTSSTVTMQQSAYGANVLLYGLTASGSKVLLANSNTFYDMYPTTGAIMDAYVDSTDFVIDKNPDNYPFAYGEFYTGTRHPSDITHVVAKKLGDNVTSSSTNLTVSFMGADNKIHALSTPIKSSTVAPEIKFLGTYVASEKPGVSVNATGDVVTYDLRYLTADADAANKSVTRFDLNGSIGALDATYGFNMAVGRPGFHFIAYNSYGNMATIPVQVTMTHDSGTGTYSMDSATNRINTSAAAFNGLVAGDVYTFTAVTSNGMVKTIKLVVVNTTP